MTNLELPHPQKCALYHNLWTDRSWVHRRIDEISFTERGMMQVKSTFDLDIAHLKEKINNLPEELRKGDQIALPLMALPRTLLLDIDVTLDGKAQSFASTETSFDVTRCIYVQEYYDKHLSKVNSNNIFLRRGWPPKMVPEIAYVSNLMYQAFRQGDGDYIETKREIISDEYVQYQEEIEKIENSSKIVGDEKKIDNILYENFAESRTRFSILDRITTSRHQLNTDLETYQWVRWSRFTGDDYIAVILVDLPKDRRRAKLTYVAKTSPDYSESANILPIRTSSRAVVCASLLGSGAEKRYHFRVNAPDGHYISSLSLADARNDNNEVAFYQPNASSGRDLCGNRNNAKPVACVTADGADLTFLEIKDNTPEGGGNIFGYTLNIGVEPFPQTFMSRAQLSIVFLLVYLLISRFITFEVGRIIPFSIAALGFLASSPLWFRIGSEDAFTHRTLKRGRRILAGLATAVFAISFANHVVNWQIRLSKANGGSVECSFVFDEHAQIIDEKYICSMRTAFSGAKTQIFLDNLWELALLSCTLYLLGIWWFFIRTYIQKDKFKIFLEQINNGSSTPGEEIILPAANQPFSLARLLRSSVLFIIGFMIFLTFRDILFTIFNFICPTSGDGIFFDFIIHSFAPYCIILFVLHPRVYEVISALRENT